MEPGKIASATRIMGAPGNWDQSKGECVGLPIEERMTEHGPVMISEWNPTTEERERLAKGLPVHLWVYGRGHPVVAISVGEEI
jgi:hypothetical protein